MTGACQEWRGHQRPVLVTFAAEAGGAHALERMATASAPSRLPRHARVMTEPNRFIFAPRDHPTVSQGGANAIRSGPRGFAVEQPTAGLLPDLPATPLSRVPRDRRLCVPVLRRVCPCTGQHRIARHSSADLAGVRTDQACIASNDARYSASKPRLDLSHKMSRISDVCSWRHERISTSANQHANECAPARVCAVSHDFTASEALEERFSM
jgi:hypothetical protein